MFFCPGPDRTLDTNQYTVIVANLLGNGVSASPSTLVPESVAESQVLLLARRACSQLD